MIPDRIDEALFITANAVVLGPWLLLLLAPRARLTRRLAHSPLPALLLVPLYVACIFFDPRGPTGGSFGSVAGILAIFASPRTAVGCWIHYLLFDLFVGAWIARDARRLGLPHLATVPSLVVTLFFGPVGYASWLLVRGLTRRRFDLDEALPVAAPPRA
ncbi:MAG: ABA4-like family protein [Byssovorax sp.]